MSSSNDKDKDNDAIVDSLSSPLTRTTENESPSSFHSHHVGYCRSARRPSCPMQTRILREESNNTHPVRPTPKASSNRSVIGGGIATKNRELMRATLTPLLVFFLLLLLIELSTVMAMAASSSNKNSDDNDNTDGASTNTSSSFSSIMARIQGIQSLLNSRPGLLLSMAIRVTLAIILQVNLDAFLKLVVTPLLAASVIGAVAAPLSFFVGQTLQPIINSFCFYGFDDPFVMATLEATGGKARLAALSKDGEWQSTGFFHRFFVRWCIKTCAGFFVGFAGLATAIPIVGPIITAALAGWAVTWDMVYIPLSGMGRVGVIHQGLSVLHHFWSYYWFGFWAVLMEEIPVVNPLCHVYNVYSAAFFLERVYLTGNNNTATTMMAGGLMDGAEL